MQQRLDEHRLLKGVQELVERDRDFGANVAAYGPPPLWEREQGFHTLVYIILEQQVSLASARAAYDKLVASVEQLTPENFLALTDEELKGIGFSRQKTGYGRALAQAIIDGSLDLPGLVAQEDQEAREQLMRVKGIGLWTADIYLLMAMGRPDIWPRGDLALEVAMQRLKGWERRPTPEETGEMSTAWRPWRAVAARLLWHYYLSEPKKD
jgi:DNA-3-methyladenine glycosylase II